MKTRRQRSRLCTLISFSAGLLILSLLVIAGDLGPAAPLGCRMNTLDEVQPRMPISSPAYTITQRGSCYLTRNHRIIAVGATANGNHRICLLGSANLAKGCIACANSNYGIQVGNGSGATGNTACDKGGLGIQVAIDGAVTNNTATGSYVGIRCANGCTVTGTAAWANRNYGILVADQSLVVNNSAYNNNLDGGYPNMCIGEFCTPG
ncbi:MAG TPA: hypothetical protein VMW16_08970 [Sedimentisphaerales bacterium]|nr:hypothetical protein [Sedimentisphaerales bacterium]